MPQTPLFTPSDLSSWLQKPVEDGTATVVEGVVWGWLRPLLDVDERPASPSPELSAAALELGGIAHENPAGLTIKEMGPFKEQYSAERRDEILAGVQSGFSVLTGTPPASQGSFPTARAYPDPAERC